MRAAFSSSFFSFSHAFATAAPVLADALAADGQTAEALTMKTTSHAVIAKVRPTQHPQRTYSEMSLGWITGLSGDPTGGMTLFRPAFDQVTSSARTLEVAQSRALGWMGNIDSYGQGLHLAWLAKDRDFSFRVAQIMVESDVMA